MAKHTGARSVTELDERPGCQVLVFPVKPQAEDPDPDPGEAAAA